MSALRLIFFALLLANVAFFAWRQSAGPAPGHEPQRLQRQIDPDKLKLIPPAPPADAKPAGTPPVAPPASPASPPPTSPAHTSAATPPALLCKSFAGLSPDAAKAAQSAIASGTPAAHVVSVPLKSVSTSWWVHIPAQANKAGADRKVAELKDMGIDDSLIVSDAGPNRWAVSLGLFSTKAAADAYLKKLNGLGVHSARISTREKSANMVRLDISAPADTLSALMHKLKPLAAATPGDCPAVAKN